MQRARLKNEDFRAAWTRATGNRPNSPPIPCVRDFPKHIEFSDQGSPTTQHMIKRLGLERERSNRRLILCADALDCVHDPTEKNVSVGFIDERRKMICTCSGITTATWR
jgi:hypothetical protein